MTDLSREFACAYANQARLARLPLKR